MKALDVVLKKRGMTKEDLREHKEETLNWKEMRNVVTKVAFEVILNDSVERIGILYDCDVDGLFSGHILEDFLIRFGKKPVRFMNSEKKHGLQKEALRWVKEQKLEWLFVVDAGSGDTREINFLVKRLGVKVVVLDHHPYDRKTPLVTDGAWVVNPIDHEHLPHLSGCGVVYRFIEQLGKKFKVMTEMYEKYVGITVLSDICDMRDAENRYYVRRAYAEYRANYMFNQFRFYGSFRSFYGYGLIPYLNALIRIGEGSRAMKMVNSMNVRAKMNTVERDRQRVRTRQQAMISELLSSGKLFEEDDFVLHLRKKKPELRPIGGLMANGFLSQYDKSAMVLYEEPETGLWVGSFRGINFDYTTLREWGFTAEGHPHACGVKVDTNTLKKFKKQFKLEVRKKKKADFRAAISGLKRQTWLTLADFNEMSGAGVPEVVIELKETVRDALRVEIVSDKRKDILFPDGTVVVDFTGKDEDTILVTPALAKNGYQLIRA